METENERYERYLQRNSGIWFASCPQMKKWAERKVSEGSLKPLSELIGAVKGTENWFCKPEFKKTADLLGYFTPTGLYQLFGVYDHCLDFQI